MKFICLFLFFICIYSCSYEQQGNIEVQINSSDFSIDSLVEDTSQDMKEKIDKSISHLGSIIERNESKISDWEMELITADSTKSVGLLIDINQMKNRVTTQKERLRRLKSKDD